MTKIGGNRWNEFVKEFAKRNNTTYGCSISMPECKAEYKAKYPKPVKEKKAKAPKKAKEAKPKGKRGRPKKSAVVDEDFGVAPESVAKEKKEPIKLIVQELDLATPELKDVPNYKKTPIIIKKKEKKEKEKVNAKYINYEGKKYIQELEPEDDESFAIYDKDTREHLGYLEKNGKIKFFEGDSSSDSDSDESISSADSRDYLSEIKGLLKKFENPLSNKELKQIRKDIVALKEFYEKKKFTETERKEYARLNKKFNEAIKGENSKKEGTGRLNRIRLKRSKKEEGGGPRTDAIRKGLSNACNAITGCITKKRDRVYDASSPDFEFTNIHPETENPQQTAILNARAKIRADREKETAKKQKSQGAKVAPLMVRDLDTGEVLPADNTGLTLNPTAGRGRGRPRKQQGGNIITDLANKGKQVINRIGNKYFGERLPPNFKKILDKYGNQPITSLTLGRTPVPSYINTALNIVSLGEWKKRFGSQPYDKLYHLYMVINTTSGRFLIEKNERLNATTSIPQGEQLAITGNLSGLTPNILLEKTEKLMGPDFYTYSAFNNNCQHFISSVMKANNLGSPKDYEFVKQDTEKLFEGQERLKKVADFTTGIGAVANKIYQGGKKPRGRPRKVGGMPLKTAQILNPDAFYNTLLQHHGAVTQMGGYETDTSSDDDMEGKGRNPELSHELRNYNEILGHLSSHLLSKENQDPKDLRDALKYAKELVRVLQQFRR